jgi:hypothetical protein
MKGAVGAGAVEMAAMPLTQTRPLCSELAGPALVSYHPEGVDVFVEPSVPDGEIPLIRPVGTPWSVDLLPSISDNPIYG